MPQPENSESPSPMRKAAPKLVLAAVLTALSAAWAVRQDADVKAPLEVFSRSAKLLAYSLPLIHLNKTPWDEAIAEQALDNFLESLDFEKSYFLQSDIDGFRAEAAALPDQVKRGDLQFALDVYDVYKERVRNRVAFVRELLEQPIDFETDESYFWKRKYADWPRDEAAWDDLWRKRIKNQLLVQLVEKEIGEHPDELDPAAPEDDGEDRKTHSQLINESLTPVEFVQRSYDKYLTVIEDNDETWVAERYLTSFARAYDPHTDYMSPNSVEDFEINMKLSLVGIGALLSNEDGAALVERLIPGGPAEQDGRLQPGDKIIAVGQDEEPPVDVLHWPLYRTVRLIRGEKNTTVVLHVIPASDPTGSTVTPIDLVRDEVKLEEQAAKGELKTLDAGHGPIPVGVITLPDFYADLSGGRFSEEARSCTRDVARLIDELTGQGAEAIVLDLRNNGGGSLSEAINLTGLFIETGPVVQVRDRRRPQTLADRDPSVIYDGPLVVLVNRLSASASEIVAGALQDYGRAILVGDSKTHGKGTVQSLAPLSSANPRLGSVKVTTAIFYRIAGGSTQLKGVQPDIVIPSALEAMELGEETLDNPLPWTTLDPAAYARDEADSALFPELVRRSAARFHADARFETYEDILSRMKERQGRKEITLRYEDRLAFAREQKDLQDRIKQKEGGGDEDGNDLVLEEAVRIAQDWVVLGARPESRPITADTRLESEAPAAF